MNDYTALERNVIAEAIKILEARYMVNPLVLTSPESSRELFRLHLEPEPAEVFAVAWLDNRHRLIHFDKLFRGTIDGASVHPRIVVQQALIHNAAAVILGHNHPSGVPTPSQADLRITTRLKDALGLIDLRILDHIIVGHGETYSFAENGAL